MTPLLSSPVLPPPVLPAVATASLPLFPRTGQGPAGWPLGTFLPPLGLGEEFVELRSLLWMLLLSGAIGAMLGLLAAAYLLKRSPRLRHWVLGPPLQPTSPAVGAAAAEALEQQPSHRQIGQQLHQATRELESLKARLQLALEATQSIVWEQNLATREIRPLGQSTGGEWFRIPEDRRGALMPVWVHPADRSYVAQQLDRARTHLTPFEFEHRMVRTDGSLGWMLTKGDGLPAGSEPARLIAVSIDITHTKQLDLALQSSEAQLKGILDATQACIAQFRIYDGDEQMHYDFWSAGAELIFGYTPEELMADGNLWPSRIPPEDYAAVIRPALQQERLGSAIAKEYRFHHKDGSLRWISSSCVSRRLQNDSGWVITAIDTDISDRKTLELALQESQARLSDILDATHACIAQFSLFPDDRLQYEFWSAGAEAVFGFTAADFMADHRLWRSRIPAEDIETVVRPGWKTLRRCQILQKTYRFRHKNGQLLWISSAANARWDDVRQCHVITVFDFDTSDQKQLALALQDSQGRLQDILNHARACIVQFQIAPQNGHITYDFWSAAAESIFGYCADAFMDDASLWRSRVLPEDLETVMAPTWQQICSGQAAESEYRFRHGDGSLRWIHSTATPRWDPTSGRWVVTTVDIDISDRKAAENDLKRFERVVSAAQDGMALLDTDFIYRLANQTYVERFGRSQGEIIGCSVAEIVGIETFRDLQPQLERCLRGESVQMEFWYDYPASGRQFVSATYSPGRDDDGSILGIVISIRNLTPLKRTEEALRISQARLQNLSANLPGVIYRYSRSTDSHDRFTYVSSGCRSLLGLEPEAILADSQTLWGMTHPEDRLSLEASLAASAARLETWQWEGRLIATSGHTYWIRGTAKPERQWSGAVVWDGLLIDVSERKAAEAALRSERDLFNEVMNTSTAAITVLNPEGHIIYANDRAETVLGLSKEHITQRTYNDPAWQLAAVDGGPWALEEQPFYQVLTTGEAVYDIRHSISWPDGQRRILSVNGAPIRNEHHQITQLVFTVNDITDQLAAETALRRSEARFRLVAENMSDLVCLHKVDGTYLYVSPSCRTLLGYEPEALVGNTPYEFFHPEDCDRIRRGYHAPGLRGVESTVTYRIRRASGEYLWLESIVKPILSKGEVVQLLTTSRDVSEKVAIQSQLQHDALHDHLTHLPNRNLLMERLDAVLQHQRQQPGFKFAVLFLDLDRFKVINDSLGHHVGDELLRAIAKILQSLIRTGDLAARLGGDEFVILLENLWDTQEAVIIAERILSTLQRPLQLNGREVFATTSIGIAIGASHYQSSAEILRDADIAMYHAKSQGKTCYAIFNPAMHRQLLREMQLETALRRAIDHQELELHYQPIISLSNRRLKGFECLLRWQHPEQGLMSPVDFIPIAEETGLIVQLSLWTVQAACQQLRAWQRRYRAARSLSVNVNLSARQLKDPELVEHLDAVLSITHLPPQCLNLEITESILIDDVDAILHTLESIRARGIGLSIDDFGTGYSSLSYLHRLPLTGLKIDRDFVADVHMHPERSGIVKSILVLADSLKLEVVAEGVETAQQLSFLRQLSCQLGQGYYFCRALPVQEMELMLQTLQPDGTLPPGWTP